LISEYVLDLDVIDISELEVVEPRVAAAGKFG
jgi:hypothetical protein